MALPVLGALIARVLGGRLLGAAATRLAAGGLGKMRLGANAISSLSGDATAASTAALVKSLDKLADDLRPIKDLGTNIFNIGLLPLVTSLDALAQVVTQWLALFGIQIKNAKGPAQMNAWQQMIIDGAKESRKSRLGKKP